MVSFAFVSFLLLSFLSFLSCSPSSAWIRSPLQLSGAHGQDPIHRITVALKQQNVHKIKQIAESVSDVFSSSYGSYLSVSEVASIVSPSPSAVSAVSEFFLNGGAISVDTVLTGDFLVVDIPLGALSSLLDVTFSRFVHAFSHRALVRSTQAGGESSWFARLPVDVRAHIELITGVHDLFETPAEIKASAQHARRRLQEQACPLSDAPEIGRVRANERAVTVPFTVRCQDGNTTQNAQAPCQETGNAVTGFTVNLASPTHAPQSLSFVVSSAQCSLSAAKVVTCVSPTIDVPEYARLNVSVVTTYASGVSDGGYLPMLLSTSPFVTPDLIFKQYNVPYGIRGTNSANSISVPGFEQQYVSIKDIQSYHQLVGLPYVAPAIIGQNDESNPGGESSLDIQYIMGTAPGVSASFWSVTGPGPAIPPGQGAYILEWALLIANTTQPPLVTSISYGDTEDGFFNKFGDYSYIDRMNVELAKMAARGLTVLAGSGDAGASNVGEAGNDVSPTDPTCAPFRAFFPSNSPYVTSVSSTFFTRDHLPICEQSVGTMKIECANLGECATSVRDGMFWTTGGGFSNLTSNPTPSWQKDAVSNYLSTQQAAGTLPPSFVFNAAGRGYPDIATIGHNLLIVLGGQITTVDGTSASGPIMAGLVALWNDARLNAGLPSMGLINSFLYASKRLRPDAFRDVVRGGNFDGDVQARCSAYDTFCPYGFKTAPGWSPVTGLGSPNWSVLRDLALKTSTLLDLAKHHQDHDL